MKRKKGKKIFVLPCPFILDSKKFYSWAPVPTFSRGNIGGEGTCKLQREDQGRILLETAVQPASHTTCRLVVSRAKGFCHRPSLSNKGRNLPCLLLPSLSCWACPSTNSGPAFAFISAVGTQAPLFCLSFSPRKHLP